jgi:hypothetical protein
VVRPNRSGPWWLGPVVVEVLKPSWTPTNRSGPWWLDELGQKRFLLAAKTPLCWRTQHPPAILCQHKWLSLLAGAHPPPLTTVLAGDISARQHSGFSKSARNSKKIYLGEEPHSPATHPSRAFFRVKSHAPRLPWFEPVTSPSRKASSTTTPHNHMRP